MLFIGKDEYPEYVKEAIVAFYSIMRNTHRDSLETINKANKGELFVLHFLAKEKREVLPSELSEALNSSTARISALLNVLEKKDQIHREIDVTNRRNILVTITPDGIQRVKDELTEMHNNMAKVFEEMGEEDTYEFIRLSRKFSEAAAKHLPMLK